MNVFLLRLVAAVALLPILIDSSAGQEKGNRDAATSERQVTFTRLTTFQNIGQILKSVVGPGPEPGQEWFYQSYIYTGGTLEIVAIDPATGRHQAYRSPVASEYGAWAMVVGPDGNIYVGTLPSAHILQLNPRTGKFIDLGRPSSTEEYIWRLAVGADKKLYGCTYPQAKLVQFDPATKELKDLGRMNSREQYAQSVAASDDGFIYVGIGTQKAHVVAYEIATGQHRDMLPEKMDVTTTAGVHRGDDGTTYASVGNQYFRLEHWEAKPVAATEVHPEAVSNRLKDGRTIVGTSNGALQIHDPKTNSDAKLPFQYKGQPIAIFRLGMGPDGMLYGSTAMPIHFLRVGPRGDELTYLGRLGGGEIYSFLNYGEKLLCAAYSGNAPLMVYDPRVPFALEAGEKSNPKMVSYDGQVSSWRPKAMIASGKGDVYLGSVAGYGYLGGPLTKWNSSSGQVESFPHTVQDQSVVTLCEANGLIIGGTTVIGGGGSHPTHKEAKLFVWDPVAKRRVFETVPVAGAKGIGDLITAPNGKVFGIAEGNTLFVFDPEQRQVVHRAAVPFPISIDSTYNSIAVGFNKNLWGLCRKGIFMIDPNTYKVTLIAKSPEPITAGFVMSDRSIYFGAGPDVYRCDVVK
jgi:outer membrane protein assembly factor BamB